MMTDKNNNMEILKTKPGPFCDPNMLYFSAVGLCQILLAIFQVILILCFRFMHDLVTLCSNTSIPLNMFHIYQVCTMTYFYKFVNTLL